MSLPESHQAFEVAAAQTSGLVNLVLSPQTFFFQCEYLSTYQPMVIIEPAVLIAGLLDLGSKLNPSNIPRVLNKDLTRFMQSVPRVRQN